ncbi:ABC-2 type transport system ATP-binding protein [Asanoa ferruginea]|uniref:ABC-2 type transport system ATP-binding protein n=1 Tax=Asanoa ferruginea TaxID=53367 RepID=A0A3D9ZP11_9ACTN|nr:ABC transporter ATP-binding protein [Asanoa ferruginea]REF98354.1 ABC-2 type transport system ATP-binding protein [Asanoa ferruginea]GIF52794.1 ABC transporter ATP-binding protein [Asanoa ferruginea]
MTAVVRAHGLGKRFGRRWALSDCTVDIPAGRVVGLVGPNGAGKTTLLRLVVGQLAPTAGDIEVLGAPAGADATLSRVGYVAQSTPVYPGFTVDEHLTLGDRLNPRWDMRVARDRVESAGLDPRQRAGRLSGGHRAQLALTMALAKRPELLVLDEPLTALDPLARREFLQGLMASTAGSDVSVVFSSHLIGDLERICDYLLVLTASRIRLAGDIDDLIASHHLLTGARRDTGWPAGAEVISARHTERQTTLVVRAPRPVDDPTWTVAGISLEDLILAYLKNDAAGVTPLEVAR